MPAPRVLPADVTQTVLFPLAYYTGDDFQPALRLAAADRTYWNAWGHLHRERQ